MNPLNLFHALELKDKEIIAVYGAGGKTTLLCRLARELARRQHKVLLTTTTKIFKPSTFPVVISSSLDETFVKLKQYFINNNIVVLGSSLLENNKLSGIEEFWPQAIARKGIASHILIEADGAARKPIKGYAPFEPVLPLGAGLLLPVLGLDALGLNLDQHSVHRPELLGNIIGAGDGEQININHINRYLKHLVKIGMECLPRARIIPVINKTDLLDNLKPVKEITSSLAGHSVINRILFTTLQDDNFPLKFVFDSAKPFPFISCVILAAGSSERMGKNKLALKIKGKTILEHSIENALGSNVGEVIVVARPENYAWVKKLQTKQTAKTVINPFYQQGISTSLKAGLMAVDPFCQGVVFALGDQPFITAGVYNALIECYARDMPMVLSPLSNGKRGNPVLFDRRTWPLLLELKGDRGGSQIFSILPKKEICNLEVSCPGILQDVDTPEDYQKFSHLT